jgi:hypothetical protein
MPRIRTTVAVHPDQAEQLRSIKDERDLPNMDAAVASILAEVDA